MGRRGEMGEPKTALDMMGKILCGSTDDEVTKLREQLNAIPANAPAQLKAKDARIAELENDVRLYTEGMSVLAAENQRMHERCGD